MSKFFGEIKAGSASVSLSINLSAQTGALPAEVTFKYWRQGAALVAVPLTALDNIADPWVAGGWIELNAGDIPAIYRLDVPNAAFIAGPDWVEIIISLSSGDAWYVERFSLSTAGADQSSPNFSYDPNLSRPLDRVRFKIGDTIEADALFQDEEIDATLVRLADNVLATSIELMRSLVRRYARMVSVRADDVSKEVGKLYTQYREQLDELLVEQRATVGSTTSGQLGGEYLKTLKPKLYC